jgi:hypothetical protein
MFKHLTAQGKPDPRGGVCCFWTPNKNQTFLDALKIIKNKIELKKLWPLKVERNKN